MRLSTPVRRATLVLHVLVAVGWFGAVASYFALALAGLRATDPQTARASYTALDLVGWWVVAPACAAAIVTGVVQAAGTAWGLTRHWWIVLKLGFTIFAAAALLVHLQPTRQVAALVQTHDLLPGEGAGARLQLVVAPALALILLGFNAALGVIKPRGLTGFGEAVARAHLRDR